MRPSTPDEARSLVRMELENFFCWERYQTVWHRGGDAPPARPEDETVEEAVERVIREAARVQRVRVMARRRRLTYEPEIPADVLWYMTRREQILRQIGLVCWEVLRLYFDPGPIVQERVKVLSGRYVVSARPFSEEAGEGDAIKPTTWHSPSKIDKLFIAWKPCVWGPGRAAWMVDLGVHQIAKMRYGAVLRKRRDETFSAAPTS